MPNSCNVACGSLRQLAKFDWLERRYLTGTPSAEYCRTGCAEGNSATARPSKKRALVSSAEFISFLTESWAPSELRWARLEGTAPGKAGHLQGGPGAAEVEGGQRKMGRHQILSLVPTQTEGPRRRPRRSKSKVSCLRSGLRKRAHNHQTFAHPCQCYHTKLPGAERV